MKTQAIIPAAGSGTRFKSATSKLFTTINDIPLIVLTLKVFEASDLIESVVLVVPENNMADFEGLIKDEGFTKVVRIVAGGDSRRESVKNGLQVIDHDTEIVVVHDAARPLLSEEVLKRALKACERGEAVITGIPIKPTVKRVDDKKKTVTETVSRNGLWEVQTPQVFKKDVLIKAHEENKDVDASDDAMLVELIDVKVKVVEGDERNIKVTTQQDRTVARAFLDEKGKK